MLRVERGRQLPAQLPPLVQHESIRMSIPPQVFPWVPDVIRQRAHSERARVRGEVRELGVGVKGGLLDHLGVRSATMEVESVHLGGRNGRCR